MSLLEIIVIGLIWGGLMIYFLMPFNLEPQVMPNMTFSQAFKRNLIKLVLHKKAILGLVLLVVTLHYFWQYYGAIQVYQYLHGEEGFAIVNPKVHAIYYMVGTCIYAVLIYLLLVWRRTYKQLVKQKQWLRL